MNARERAIELCTEIQERQIRLSELLRETRIYDMVRAQAEATAATESMLTPTPRHQKQA